MNIDRISARKAKMDGPEDGAEVSPKGVIVLRHTTITGWKSFKEIEEWADGKRCEYKDGALYVYDNEITNEDAFKDKHGRKLKCDKTCTLIYRFIGQHTLKGDSVDDE